MTKAKRKLSKPRLVPKADNSDRQLDRIERELDRIGKMITRLEEMIGGLVPVRRAVPAVALPRAALPSGINYRAMRWHLRDGDGYAKPPY